MTPKITKDPGSRKANTEYSMFFS